MKGPIKWHGGKSYLAPKIVALMPPRVRKPNAPDAGDPGYLHYVEPYFGGGSVLLANDPEGISEVANDLNRELTNFWACLQNDRAFAEFGRQAQAIPFSQVEYLDACRPLTPEDCADGYGRFSVVQAVRFFIRCRQSLSGRMKGFASISRTRTRQGMNEQAAAWLSAVEGLPAIHARLRRILILNKPALDVIRSEDGPRTLFYLDPPYLHETRATTGEYEHEMSKDQHQELLEAVAMNGAKARFILSGYRSELYDRALSGWNRHDFNIANHAAGGDEKRRMTECVWCNY